MRGDHAAKGSSVCAMFTFLLSRYRQGTDPDVPTGALLCAHKKSRHWSPAKGKLRGLFVASRAGINTRNCAQFLISLGWHFWCHKGIILWFILFLLTQHIPLIKKSNRLLSDLLFFYRQHFARVALFILKMFSKHYSKRAFIPVLKDELLFSCYFYECPTWLKFFTCNSWIWVSPLLHIWTQHNCVWRINARAFIKSGLWNIAHTGCNWNAQIIIHFLK